MSLDALLPEILDHVRHGRNLVVEAAPGAGKTTRIPPALLDVSSGEVLVLEPRRLAARMAARFVAAQRGERLGETVGYQVRFEDVSGPKTRLRYMTEGVLTRTLLSDPKLRRAGIVVLDEFHERHLDTDLALALLRRLQQERRDLRIVVMSATMDTAPVSRFLGDCPVVRSAGRQFPLEISFRPHSPAPLEERVAGAVEDLVHAGLDGDVLVFLPGAAEIRRAARACEGVARRAGLVVAPLHGDLSPEEQDRAVEPCAQRKVILSTNVAESSITIEGVTSVIDSGVARIASDSPWTGLPRLQIARISQAPAVQRAGRAGRLRPGRVIRLYPEEDFRRRALHDSPEITRRELSQLTLDLRAMGIASPADLDWLDAPPRAAIEAAVELLDRLGASRDGKEMARFPLHPRLARLAIEGGREGCTLAALLSWGRSSAGQSDVLALLDGDWHPRARQLVDQIRRLSRPARRDLPQAVLMAFPDRIGKRRGTDLLLSSGGSARLAGESRHDLLVAVEIEERPDQGQPIVRLTSPVEPEWLLDLFPGRMREETHVEWNRAAERVDAVSVLLYDQLAIAETRGAKPDPEAASRLLAERAWEAGVERFADRDSLASLRARLHFAAQHSSLPELMEDHLRAALDEACTGLRSFAEIKSAGNLQHALERQFPRRLLDEIAPQRLRLPGGRHVAVQYAAGQAPWIASRLQDFFGMRETPCVAGGKVPVVVHLLAPNQRPVQTTTDLAGFWQRLYPTVRRELSRRYPKHAWPENPGA
jgi:ATP-dependent helicase HrpB